MVDAPITKVTAMDNHRNNEKEKASDANPTTDEDLRPEQAIAESSQEQDQLALNIPHFRNLMRS
jgi:hypothetical protein